MQDLEKTNIQSPFNATVVTRLVSPGQYLSPGEQVAQLYGIDQIEISVSLPITDWQYLPSEQSEVKGQAVVMKDRYGNSWQGHIDRFEHHINSQSRQRKPSDQRGTNCKRTKPPVTWNISYRKNTRISI